MRIEIPRIEIIRRKRDGGVESETLPLLEDCSVIPFFSTVETAKRYVRASNDQDGMPIRRTPNGLLLRLASVLSGLPAGQRRLIVLDLEAWPVHPFRAADLQDVVDVLKNGETEVEFKVHLL